MAKETKKENNRHFFKDFKAELKKVIWPTPKQVANNTTAVVTIVLLTAVIVFALDVIFEKLNTQGVDRLRSIVSESDSVENSIDGNTISDSVIDENTVTENTISDENSIDTNTVNENTVE